MLTPIVFGSRTQELALAVSSAALASFVALIAYAGFQAMVDSPLLRDAFLVAIICLVGLVARRAMRARTIIIEGHVEVQSVLRLKRLPIDEIVTSIF